MLTMCVVTAGRKPLRAELVEVNAEELAMTTVVALKVGEMVSLRPLSARGAQARTLECVVLNCQGQGRGYTVTLSTVDQSISGSWLGWRLRTNRPQRKRPRIQMVEQTPVTVGNVASTLVDLGIGGAQINTELSLEVGGSIELELASPHHAPVKLSAEVVGVREGDQGTLVNLRFLRGQGACRRALSRHILALTPAA